MKPNVLRKKTGLRVSGLASLLGVSRQAVYDAIRDERDSNTTWVSIKLLIEKIGNRGRIK